MSDLDIRELYIDILMQDGMPRECAEDYVDVTDDGKVVRIITKEELYFLLAFRDYFRTPESQVEFADLIAYCDTLIKNAGDSVPRRKSLYELALEGKKQDPDLPDYVS